MIDEATVIEGALVLPEQKTAAELDGALRAIQELRGQISDAESKIRCELSRRETMFQGPKKRRVRK